MTANELLLPVVTNTDGTEVVRAIRSNGQVVQIPLASLLGDGSTPGVFSTLTTTGAATIGNALVVSAGGATITGSVGFGVTPVVPFQVGNATNRGGLEPRSDGDPLGGVPSANYMRSGGWYQSNPIPGASVNFAAQGAAGQRGALAFATKNVDDDTTQTIVRAVVAQDGKVGIGDTNPTALFDVNSDIIRLRTAKTPATAGAAGNAGDICWDANYLYVCVASSTWKRAALSTW